ncbi:MAG: class I SAM-dependent methyltransferase [Aliishimia sp.]
MTDRETLDVYDAKAGEYAVLVGEDKGPDRQLRRFLEQLPENARVWDLGCGPGRSAGLMAAAGHRALATDASEAMIALAGDRPGVEARLETFDDIAGDAEFDGIFANFSLLHAQEDALPLHIAAISKALKPKGIFHIGMKTGTGTKRDQIGRRYTYVTEDSLRGMFGQNDLIPTDVWFGESVGLDGVEAPWIVMQARKND